MRVALYGGSFNPPHVAHQLVCAYVLATARPLVERVLMIPTFRHPFGKPLEAFAHRVEMCRIAASLFGGLVEVSRIEEELGGDSYTLTTVKALRERRPGVRLSLVIGADLVAERERWHGWDELKTLIDFIVVGRQGNGDGQGGKAPGIELPPISSTEIRARLADGRSVDGMVDARVADYIRAHGLYGAREP
jgi:nicotinate-nucleotide adenylyltransferase